jgi:hypothetical protein
MMTFQQVLYGAFGVLVVIFLLMGVTAFVLWRRVARHPDNGDVPKAPPFWMFAVGIVLFSVFGLLTLWIVREIKPARKPVALTLFQNAAVVKRLNASLLKVLGPKEGIRSCSHALLGAQRDEKRIFVYVWAACESFSITKAEIKRRSGSSLPAVVVLHASNWRVKKVLLPGDGSMYVRDVRRLFPRALHKRITQFQVADRATLQALFRRNRKKATRSFQPLGKATTRPVLPR